MLKKNKPSLGKKIVLTWFLLLIASAVSLLFTSQEVTIASFLTCVSQLLLFLLSLYIAKREPTQKNRLIFVNFSLFFSTSIVFHLANFVDSPMARFHFIQYFSFGVYYILLSFCVVYLTIDAVFREFKTIQKYILSILIVGIFSGYYYAPFLADARYAYKTEVVLNWKELTAVREEYVNKNSVEPSREQLAQLTDLHMYKDGISIGTVTQEEKQKRVNELYPYLFGSNYVVLVSAPMYRNVIYMNILCVGFIIFFFGYQYKKDPPQGAYIEKIMFLLMVFCTMEIVHAWSFINSLQWETLFELTSMGHYISSGILFVISFFFGLRLRFITSANGEYYEQEIIERPAGVTRWRDLIDDFVIAHFFDRKAILGRMFVKEDEK